MYQRKWMPHVGEKATTVREPGSEHDRFAVAVLKDATLCTVGHFFLVLSLFASLVVSTISEAEHPSGSFRSSLHYSLLPVFAIFIKLWLATGLLRRSLCCLNFYFRVTSHK